MFVQLRGLLGSLQRVSPLLSHPHFGRLNNIVHPCNISCMQKRKKELPRSIPHSYILALLLPSPFTSYCMTPVMHPCPNSTLAFCKLLESMPNIHLRPHMLLEKALYLHSYCAWPNLTYIVSPLFSEIEI
jgi:hypothetical protein